MAHISFTIPQDRKQASVSKLCMFMAMTILLYLAIVAEIGQAKHILQSGSDLAPIPAKVTMLQTD